MSSSTIQLSPPLADYLRSVAVREPPVLARLREETLSITLSQMQICPEQGALMGLLMGLIGARRTLEVGVYTGYSSLAVALALPDDGRVTACDVNKAWTDVARRYWDEAGVAGKIDLRLAPAITTLDALLAEGRAETYDFAFLDADKVNYDGYYERALKLVRPGGLIGIDNVLWHGKVIDQANRDADTEAIRALNSKIHGDARVTVSMVPIGDGLTLAQRRS
jgi:predicted O-methyltransferase YrrM